MIKPCFLALISIGLILHTAMAVAEPVTGLEIDNPQTLHVVYTTESVQIDKRQLETIVDNSLSMANIDQGQRDDAQLFLRVEQHADQYLLYLDFSRKVYYRAGDKCFSKDGFVWGRYVKDITDIEELYEDIQFVIDEFIEAYVEVNGL